MVVARTALCLVLGLTLAATGVLAGSTSGDISGFPGLGKSHGNTECSALAGQNTAKACVTCLLSNQGCMWDGRHGGCVAGATADTSKQWAVSSKVYEVLKKEGSELLWYGDSGVPGAGVVMDTFNVAQKVSRMSQRFTRREGIKLAKNKFFAVGTYCGLSLKQMGSLEGGSMPDGLEEEPLRVAASAIMKKHLKKFMLRQLSYMLRTGHGVSSDLLAWVDTKRREAAAAGDRKEVAITTVMAMLEDGRTQLGIWDYVQAKLPVMEQIKLAREYGSSMEPAALLYTKASNDNGLERWSAFWKEVKLWSEPRYDMCEWNHDCDNSDPTKVTIVKKPRVCCFDGRVATKGRCSDADVCTVDSVNWRTNIHAQDPTDRGIAEAIAAAQKKILAIANRARIPNYSALKTLDNLNCHSGPGWVQNQNSCGTCWAFASSTALSQRLCMQGAIMGAGTKPRSFANVLASPQGIWESAMYGDEYAEYKWKSRRSGLARYLFTARYKKEWARSYTHGGFATKAYEGIEYTWKNDHVGVTPVSCRPYLCQMESSTKRFIVGATRDDVNFNNQCVLKEIKVTTEPGNPMPFNTPVKDESDRGSSFPYLYIKQDRHLLLQAAETIEEVEKEVRENGPVYVALDAALLRTGDMMLSRWGRDSNGKRLDVKFPTHFALEGNHAVVIVGYGTDVLENGELVPYWLIQNSWGEHWNGKGYMKIQRGFAPQCVDWLTSNDPAATQPNGQPCGMDFLMSLAYMGSKGQASIVGPKPSQATLKQFKRLYHRCDAKDCHYGHLNSDCECQCYGDFVHDAKGECTVCARQCGDGTAHFDRDKCRCECEEGFYGPDCNKSVTVDVCWTAAPAAPSERRYLARTSFTGYSDDEVSQAASFNEYAEMVFFEKWEQNNRRVRLTFSAPPITASKTSGGLMEGDYAPICKVTQRGGWRLSADDQCALLTKAPRIDRVEYMEDVGLDEFGGGQRRPRVPRRAFVAEHLRPTADKHFILLRDKIPECSPDVKMPTTGPWGSSEEEVP